MLNGVKKNLFILIIFVLLLIAIIVLVKISIFPIFSKSEEPIIIESTDIQIE